MSSRKIALVLFVLAIGLMAGNTASADVSNRSGGGYSGGHYRGGYSGSGHSGGYYRGGYSGSGHSGGYYRGGYSGSGHYGGYYRGGHYGGHHGGYYRGGVDVAIGWPFWGPSWYSPYYYPGYYPYYYPGYSYYYPPAVEVPSSPPAYIEREEQAEPSAPEGVWYYCPESKAYYPYVRECPGGWQTVQPQPPSGQRR